MRLIDADELRDRWLYDANGNEYEFCPNDVLDSIDDQPTIEAEPVVHAHWEFVPEKDKTIKDYWWDCSNCQKRVGGGLAILKPTPRCPRCGAHMDEEATNGE